jgi:hypothetical protein
LCLHASPVKLLLRFFIHDDDIYNLRCTVAALI